MNIQNKKISKNYRIPVSNGIFEHKKEIGNALWLFLWYIDKTTKEYTDENGIKWGRVYGGMPFCDSDPAGTLGDSKNTVKRDRQTLTKKGYIRVKRTPYGQIVEVKKSIKWGWKPPAFTPISGDRDTANMPYLSGDRDRPNMVYLSGDRDSPNPSRDSPNPSRDRPDVGGLYRQNKDRTKSQSITKNTKTPNSDRTNLSTPPNSDRTNSAGDRTNSAGDRTNSALHIDNTRLYRENTVNPQNLKTDGLDPLYLKPAGKTWDALVAQYGDPTVKEAFLLFRQDPQHDFNLIRNPKAVFLKDCDGYIEKALDRQEDAKLAVTAYADSERQRIAEQQAINQPRPQNELEVDILDI